MHRIVGINVFLQECLPTGMRPFDVSPSLATILQVIIEDDNTLSFEIERSPSP